ncbi:unnamed protein product [Timema podura]|uniref:EGF-like domain-containing protein n=1 Tax=Timema podura TaxID=61482 RepID=A0ABN7NH86_TIMPD|nr:unnamed protein product [Timema podura]
MITLVTLHYMTLVKGLNQLVPLLLYCERTPSVSESCDQANDCSVYGACTLDATSDKYVCVCLPGYLGDGYYCVDSELHSNYTGSGVPVPTCVLGICWCPEGYDLQGQNSCAKKSDYEDPVTDTDTEDSLILSRPEPACYNSTLCFCPTGYTYEPLTGTCDLPPGANSQSHGTMGPTGHKPSCNIVNTCHPHAQCVLLTQDNKYRCQCDAGYEGDGYECGEIDFMKERRKAEGKPRRGVEIQLRFWGVIIDCEPLTPLSEVRRGNLPLWGPVPLGNGITCVPDVSCEEVDICDIHATCTYDELREKAVCLCNPGYQGDGILCSVAVSIRGYSTSTERTCTHHLETCPWSLGCCLVPCPKWALGGRLTCNHPERFVCVFVDECSGPEDCGGNAKCDWSRERQHYACLCVEGHVREGALCVAVATSSTTATSTPSSLYDSESDEHRCVCDAGFTGDGNSCSVDHISCNVLNSCVPGAECVYDRSAGGHRCRCVQGFHGDGLNCAPDYSCQQNPNLCSRDASCVLGPTGAHTCVCNQGYVGDGSKCKAASKYEGNFLLVSQGMATLRIPFKPKGRDVPRPISIQYFQMAIGLIVPKLDYSSSSSAINTTVCFFRHRHRLFGRKGLLERCEWGRHQELQLRRKQCGSPEGVSVDWVSRNLYWTDSSKDTLEVAGLDSQLRKTLVSEGLVNPRGVVVHPTRGKVFWSDWNREAPKLEWANQDGSGRAVFLEGPAVQLPNSLAIDFDRDELCWADAGTKSIECVGIGNLAQRTVVANCSYPFGLTISHNSYYWTDWQTQRVESAERPSGKLNQGVDVPLGGSGKLYGIVAVPEHCHRQSNVCQFDNGQCSTGHLCLPNGSGGRSCLCGDNLDTEGSGEAPICNDI